jgi:uncharacterized integral membrane protein
MAAPSEERHKTQRDRREQARIVVGLTVIILAIVFAVVNLNSVEVDWIVSSSKAPLIIVIAISVVGGFVLGWLGHRGSTRRRR